MSVARGELTYTLFSLLYYVTMPLILLFTFSVDLFFVEQRWKSSVKSA